MTRTLALTLSLVFASFASPGCSVISSTPTTDQSKQLTLEVSSAPPPEKQEKQSESPGFGYIWVSGYWDYLDGNYVWRNGRWTQARPDYEYVRARYEFDGKTWLFHRPHWKRRKAQDQPAPAAAPAPTPAQ